MNAPIKQPLLNNAHLKVMSLLLGYTLWNIVSQLHPISKDMTLPLCYYDVPADLVVENAPESIKVTLRGYRKDLQHLDRHQLAVHLNGQNLHAGKNLIAITHEDLFLPRQINVVHYKPSNLIIQVASITPPEQIIP